MNASLANAILKNNRKLLKKHHLPYMGKKRLGGVARKKKGSYNKVSAARLKRIRLHKKRQRRVDGIRTLCISIAIIIGLTIFFWFVLG